MKKQVKINPVKDAFNCDEIIIDREKGRIIGKKYKNGKNGKMYISLVIGNID